MNPIYKFSDSKVVDVNTVSAARADEGFAGPGGYKPFVETDFYQGGCWITYYETYEEAKAVAKQIGELMIALKEKASK